MKLDNTEKTTDSGGTSKSRIDFEKGIPEILYKRAGGRCSVPRCKNPTMGPFTEGDGAVNMGTACHIFSAAENGPRGRGGKDAKFISGAENGIWCCNYHGSLIDKAKGKDYSAETLFAWKKLAEARVTKLLNDAPSPLGWVESIAFTEFASSKKLPRISLSRYTLLTGRNESGKSVLMEIAAAVSNAKFGERFMGTKIRKTDGTAELAAFSAEVLYSTVDYHDKKITIIIRNDVLTRMENQVPSLLPPGDIEIILISENSFHKQKHEDDVDFMMRVLNVDKTALFALAKIGTKTIMPGTIEFIAATDSDDEGNSFPVEKENGDPYIELLFTKTGSHPVSFNGLSGSEHKRLIIDMFVSKAREVCKQRLTLLLIDDVVWNFDKSNFANLLTKLSQEDFQSVVTLPSARNKDVLAETDEKLSLQELDYLTPWRLVVVDAFPLRG